MVEEEENVFVGTQFCSLYALLHILAQHPFNASDSGTGKFRVKGCVTDGTSTHSILCED